MIINLPELSVSEIQNWLQYAIAPRPIALVSSIDWEGNPNLAPFSFFNVVSSSPPIVIFSPAKRVRDNTTKHSLQNLYHVPEVVINIVTYEMVQQTSLASCEFPKGVDEFVKAGFTKQNATQVRPFMVKESPVKFECKVIEKKPLGKSGGAGNLIIAEVLCMHISEEILDVMGGMIDQTKLNHVARLGGDWYALINETALFKVPKPSRKVGIGMDSLPDWIYQYQSLTRNDLAQLANIDALPQPETNSDDIQSEIMAEIKIGRKKEKVESYVKELLIDNNISLAWQVLLNHQQTNDLTDIDKSLREI
jgi:flavin reductase (DIM6/NTAB) family NADH-FMN oxidoreductase RutF